MIISISRNGKAAELAVFPLGAPGSVVVISEACFYISFNFFDILAEELLRFFILKGYKIF